MIKLSFSNLFKKVLDYYCSMDYITDSFDPFSKDESLIKKWLIGSLIGIASIFILPYFLYQGYLLKILRETEGKAPTKLPEWDNFGKLFVDGLVAFLISFCISLPAYVIIYVPQLAGAESSVILIAQGIGSLISLVVSYLTLALLALYAREGMNGLFNFDKITTILLSVEYLIANVIVFIIGAVMGVFILMLVLFTFGFGLLLLPFIVPPVNYLVMLIMGNAITSAQNGGGSNGSDGAMERGAMDGKDVMEDTKSNRMDDLDFDN